MPWKNIGKSEARRAFVEACWKQKTSIAEACRCFGISRQCGHKWWRRAQEEGWSKQAQLADRSHRTRAAERLQQRWGGRVLALRRRHPCAGADQLRWYLELEYPLGPWPGVRTITDWLQSARLTRRRRRRARPGPQVERQRSVALRPNDVWTIDFKGWFYTRDGQRVLALTVRDGATGFLLLVRDMKSATDRHVRKVLIRLFRRYGLPRVMRSDNGPPFGGEGPRGWSSLAVWWVGLGIKVEYGRPGCPEDNAAHEQMHQVLKQETTQPAALTRVAQQRRFDRWRNKYNHHRPHQGLGMHPRGCYYRPSPGPVQLQSWSYPADCELKRADPRGRIHWRNQPRHIGRAFARQIVALKPRSRNSVAVYFGPHLLGELHASDCTGIRAVRVHTRKGRRG